MNKDELSGKLNDLLELEIEVNFKRLTKEDLEELYAFLSLPKNLVEVMRRAARGRVNEDFMNMKVKDFLEPGGEGEGPLGLGILPKLREKIHVRNK